MALRGRWELSPHWLLLLFALSCRASLLREVITEVVSPSLFYDALGTRLFDPQGRVLQLEYALQATKKGGAAVAAVSGDFGVIASWSARVSDRQCKSTSQATRGIWRGDSHVALAASGMITDAMVLVDMARKECLSHRYIYNSPIRLGRLMSLLQKDIYDTERNRIIPYAVDLLVCGADEGGTFLYNIGPSSIYESFQAYAVGHKAEEAKTYISSHIDELDSKTPLGLRDLISVVLRSLAKTFPHSADESKASSGPDAFKEDIALAVVGKGLPVTEVTVSWNPKTRRLEVSLPASLAAM